MKQVLWGVALVVSMVAGCSNEPTVVGTDGGPVAPVDGGPVAPVDGGPVALVDGGPVALVDAGPITGDDAGPIGGTDAGPTTGCAPVVGLSSNPAPGQIDCGAATCASPQVCCTSLSGQMCTAASACAGGFSAPGACDGPEDCSAGQNCCVGFPSGAQCTTGACAGGSQELCICDADCGAGMRCTGCVPPTGGIGGVVVYGICTAGGTCPSPYTAP